jgi:glycosyltransferase 2 family protein
MDAFAQADYLWILPFLGTLAGVQLFRAWRWKFLLQPVTTKPPGLWRLLVISSVGFAAIIMLPLRLGEFVRPYLIADPRDVQPDAATGTGGKRLRVSAALGTIAVERVMDGLMVSLFLFTSFLFLADRPQSPGWMMPTAYTALAVFGGATVFLLLGLWRPSFAVSAAGWLTLLTPLSRRFGGRLERLRIKLEDLLGGLISGFSALSDAGCLFRFVTASLIYWLFNGLSFYVLARAFHLDLPLVSAYAICGMVAIGIILPAGPGLVGNFHEFGKFGLQISLPAAVIAGPGMAFIVAIHGLQFLWYVGVGLLALRSRHARLSQVIGAVAEKPPPDPE